MHEYDVREFVARMMNPGAELTIKTIDTDNVQQFLVETVSVAVGSSIVRYETQVMYLGSDTKEKCLASLTSTEQEAQSAHQEVVAEVSSYLGV